MLSDIRFTDPLHMENPYRPDYDGDVSKMMRESGVLVGLVSTAKNDKKRGTWDPNYVTLHHFPSIQHIQDFYNAGKKRELYIIYIISIMYYINICFISRWLYRGQKSETKAIIVRHNFMWYQTYVNVLCNMPQRFVDCIYGHALLLVYIRWVVYLYKLLTFCYYCLYGVIYQSIWILWK